MPSLKRKQFVCMTYVIMIMLMVFYQEETYHIVQHCKFYNDCIGPSGVRALPLAASINEGDHYFRYFNLLSSFFHRFSKPQKGLL